MPESKPQRLILAQNWIAILNAYRSLYCPQDRGCGHVPNALQANRAYATRLVVSQCVCTFVPTLSWGQYRHDQNRAQFHAHPVPPVAVLRARKQLVARPKATALGRVGCKPASLAIIE
jgi:hypothetical protein